MRKETNLFLEQKATVFYWQIVYENGEIETFSNENGDTEINKKLLLNRIRTLYNQNPTPNFQVLKRMQIIKDYVLDNEILYYQATGHLTYKDDTIFGCETNGTFKQIITFRDDRNV